MHSYLFILTLQYLFVQYFLMGAKIIEIISKIKKDYLNKSFILMENINLLKPQLIIF